RRDAMLGLGQIGLGSLTLPGLLRAERAAAATPDPARPAGGSGFGRARSCILVFLWGGPPQQDMWDLKPDAPDGIRSLFKPIPSRLSGYQVSDQMPLFAGIADKVTVVRSVTHGSDNHEPSVYHMLTGQVDPTMVVPRNNRRRTHAPGPGAVLSCLRPSAPRVPSSVTLPRPIMHDGVKYSGTHAGWLGAAHDPLELPDAGFAQGRPVFDLGLPAGLDVPRLTRRRGLLGAVEEMDRRTQTHPEALGLDAYRERAFNLLVSSEAKEAFDLDRETAALRDRYGRNHYGEAFLLARRLIEAGVRLVTINWMFFRPDGNPLNPWDNHGGTPALGSVTGYEMLKAEYCLPSLDRSYAALIADLDARGLLDETLVVAMGEFGRTPKINKTVGRDHWGALQSVVLAGGGIRRGFVYGSSDAEAAYPSDNPVRPEELLATMYHSLGIRPDTELLDREARPHTLVHGEPVLSLFG
ncbi:MAG: DUF1501 domain-containing protein, partial [SAR202 cluster bacterium]|nr:DUF1501 domain-containing protein [SAR202 cluster bacterium]